MSDITNIDLFDTLSQNLHVKGNKRGWLKCNGVCCTHNGASRPDTRGRGGLLKHSEGISYHCFNCGYKASYKDGRRLSKNMRKLLEWCGTSPSDIKKIEFRSFIKAKHDPTPIPKKFIKPLEFSKARLPDNARKFRDLVFDENPPREFLEVLRYAETRVYGNILDYDFYWTMADSNVVDIKDRFIIPFRWEGNIVGWTARKIINDKAKYFSKEPSNYIFNTEAITDDDQCIFVTEGPLDALSIDGVAMLGDRCSEPMADWLNQQEKMIIVVPDMQNNGGNLVEIALKNGWYVAFPQWGEGIKDANEAVLKYGRTFVVQSIVENCTNSSVKISINSRMKIGK